MFVNSPGRRPPASRIEASRNAVVVLPFVPVTAATSSSREGSPKKVVGAGDAEKERPRHDRAHVVGEIGDLDRSRVRNLDRAERRDQAVELHRRNASGGGQCRPR
jgi:hypothetical protein